MGNKIHFVEKEDSVFVPEQTGSRSYPDLPAGIYNVEVHETFFGSITLFTRKEKFYSDEIIEISGLHNKIIKEFERFLHPKQKLMYKQLGLIPKRNVLFYGEPGTGKSMAIQLIAANALEQDTTVLICSDVEALTEGVSNVKANNPDRSVLVIMEEFEEWNESALLTYLDGPEQYPNVMYLATTNYIDKISDRLKRPGRFSKMVELPPLNKRQAQDLLMKKFQGVLSVEEIKTLAKKLQNKPIANVINEAIEYALYEKPLEEY